MHSSVKGGVKFNEWELQKLLEAMWQSYMMHLQDKQCTKTYQNQQIISSQILWSPKKCAEKTESLIKEYQRFVTHVSTLKKNQQPDSKNSSFIVLNKMIHDPIISAKFFKMVSHKLNAFLQGFQTDSPIIPFFGDVLGGIVNDLLERIFLKDVLLKVTNLHQSSCF